MTYGHGGVGTGGAWGRWALRLRQSGQPDDVHLPALPSVAEGRIRTAPASTAASSPQRRATTATATALIGLLTAAVCAQPPVSGDGARVPPLTSVTDAAGRTYAFTPDTTGCRPVVINGDASNAGCGSELLIWQGKPYTLGVGAIWWRYTGFGWENVGPVDPSTIQSPPITPGPAVPGPSPTTADLGPQVTALRATVDALMARVAELQRRIAQLETAGK